MRCVVLAFLLAASRAAGLSDVLIAGSGNGTFYGFTITSEGGLGVKHALTHTVSAHVNTSTTEWVLAHPSLPIVYVVDNPAVKTMPGRVITYRLHQSHDALLTVEELGAVSSGGAGPCFMEVDDPEAPRWLFVANYLGGSGASIPIMPDGMLGSAASVTETPPGHAQFPIAGFQDQSYAHCIRLQPYTQRHVLIADAGLNIIRHYHFNSSTGTLTPNGFTNTSIWRPRHFTFHPDVPMVYVVHELSSMLSVWSFDITTGRLEGRAELVLPATAPSFINTPAFIFDASQQSSSLPAEILFSKSTSTVLVSNRGADSIALYSADPETALLSTTAFPASGGNSPRHLLITGSTNETLWVSNEVSKSIAVYSIQAGELRLLANESGVPGPQCTAYISRRQF